MQADATAHAGRIRGLYADSAATKAQLDQAETGLARADAAVASARAMAAELAATASYADVRAPFAGIVTRRFVDPGAFAAPGAPLVIGGGRQHAAGHRERRARCGARPAARQCPRGHHRRRDRPRHGRGGGALRWQPLHRERARSQRATGASRAAAPPRSPCRAEPGAPCSCRSDAIVRQGDLTGVRVTVCRVGRRFAGSGSAAVHGAMIEVLSGLAAGDTVLVAGRGALSHGHRRTGRAGLPALQAHAARHRSRRSPWARWPCLPRRARKSRRSPCR